MSEEQGFIQRGSELWELAQDYLTTPAGLPTNSLKRGSRSFGYGIKTTRTASLAP